MPALCRAKRIPVSKPIQRDLAERLSASPVQINARAHRYSRKNSRRIDLASRPSQRLIREVPIGTEFRSRNAGSGSNALS